MHTSRITTLTVLLAVLLSGCGTKSESALRSLDPEAPAAMSLPVWNGPDDPSPLTRRSPFGLYATPPNNDTLVRLSAGALSPDGRFRAALTEQGAWMARADGAWLWHVELPAPEVEDPAPGALVDQNVEPPPPAPQIVDIDWSTRSTLLVRDETGVWHEAYPDWAVLTELPPGINTKDRLIFSPDNQQVLYYIGEQLWVARADGSNPRYLGVNVIGSWNESNQPVVEEIKPPDEAPGIEDLRPSSAFDTPQTPPPSSTQTTPSTPRTPTVPRTPQIPSTQEPETPDTPETPQPPQYPQEPQEPEPQEPTAPTTGETPETPSDPGDSGASPEGAE